MPLLPLVVHPSPDNIIAWCGDGPVTRQQFLADVNQLAASLLPGGHLLNACGDRYRFSVGLAAAIVAGKVSLLPPAHTAEMVRQLKTFAPDVFCLTDNDDCTLDMPQLRYPIMSANENTTFAVPQINPNQLIAIVFTSGSTGEPSPHLKTWAALISSVQAEASRLGLLDNALPCTLIGTVPPQHMYGFESTVLMAWQSGHALSHAQPFYPADICRALTNAQAPRVLISSPVHLRALLDAELAMPEIACVVSATAPLSLTLAQAIEAHWQAPLMEIYGSTETGLIATRRATQNLQWQLLPGIKLVVDGDNTYACGGHIATQIAINDIIEPFTAEFFLLHGRLSDLVNIAGKRHSLASLNYLLNKIPGVVDGVFYMPDENDTHVTSHASHTLRTSRVTRLAACVVAPGVTSAQLLAALREHIDVVFLPRPLLFVDVLPRNDTGKLPRAALRAMFQPAQISRKSA